MISLTHLIFGLSIAYILDKRLLTASIFALVPDFDVTFNFLYPFVHRGLMHSIVAAAVFSGLVYVYSEDRGSAESVLVGYLSHLLLDSLSFSGVPLFFPFLGTISLSIASAYSLKFNSAFIAFSLSFILVKKNPEIFKEYIDAL